jgi:ribonuclease BN (tRNA processing enzyme)
LLEAAGRRIWVDAGTGTLIELLRHTTLVDLDAIWISHLHADHCSDLLMAGHALTYGRSRPRPLPVLGPAGLATWVDAFPREPGGMVEVFTVVELTDGAEYAFGDLTLQAVATRHSVDTFGLRATCEGDVLSYTADSAPCDAVTRLARDADLFVCEAFLSTPEPLGFSTVMTPEDAGRAAAAGGARRLVLTHLHPEADPARARARAATAFGGPIEIAEQGRTFTLGPL